MKHTISKENRNKSGVYCIKNLITNDIYIGCTKCFIERYRGHLNTLKSGKSGCRILRDAVIKYGLINFEFSVLEATDNYEQREVELLQELKPRYNIVVELQERRILSEESKRRMSASQKGRIPWNKGQTGFKYNRVRKHQVISYNIETNEEIHHLSVEAAANHFNFKIGSIYYCCNNKRNSLNGIKFKYEHSKT